MRGLHFRLLANHRVDAGETCFVTSYRVASIRFNVTITGEDCGGTRAMGRLKTLAAFSLAVGLLSGCTGPRLVWLSSDRSVPPRPPATDNVLPETPPSPPPAAVVRPTEPITPERDVPAPVDLGNLDDLPVEWWRAAGESPSETSVAPEWTVNPVFSASPIPDPIIVTPTLSVASDPCSAETPSGAFPWPPKRPSARTPPARYTLFDATPSLTLGEVSSRIEGALQNAGYRQWSHYTVPGGFATVTQLEQIDLEGRAYAGQDRWEPNLIQDETVGLFGRLLMALSGAPEGRFRVMALIVTDKTIRPCDDVLERGEAQDLVELGPDRLGAERVDLIYSQTHRLSAFIYEYQKTGLGNPILVTPTDPEKHVIGSRLSEFLQ